MITDWEEGDRFKLGGLDGHIAWIALGSGRPHVVIMDGHDFEMAINLSIFLDARRIEKPVTFTKAQARNIKRNCVPLPSNLKNDESVQMISFDWLDAQTEK